MFINTVKGADASAINHAAKSGVIFRGQRMVLRLQLVGCKDELGEFKFWQAEYDDIKAGNHFPGGKTTGFLSHISTNQWRYVEI